MRVSECASLAAARISIKCPNPDLGPAAREEERPCHESFLGENDKEQI